MPPRSAEPIQSNPKLHEKLIHSLSLSIFSDSGVESGTALNDLYHWSCSSSPRPTPILISSLVNFIKLHYNHWSSGPSNAPALVALSTLFNLTHDPETNVIRKGDREVISQESQGAETMRPRDPNENFKNSFMIASSAEAIQLFIHILNDKISPLYHQTEYYFPQIARFCNLQHVFVDSGINPEIISDLCTSFMIADPSEDEAQIHLFLMFSFLPQNFSCFVSELGADTITYRLSQLLDYPLYSLTDIILELVYSIIKTNNDFKDAVCSSTQLLRALLVLSIPPGLPPNQGTKPTIPRSCQKAITLLLTLADDPRVIGYLANYKLQITSTMLKWKSKSLPELALKVANASAEK